jgi:hypothetical protein
MATAQGVAKQIRFKRQTVKGTLAGATLGQILRRTSGSFELVKETYTTESEITSTQQLLSNRHGVKTVNGKVSGILSPGTYSDLMSAILRRDFAAVTAATAVSLTVAGTGPTWTVTRAAGSYITDGFRVGMVVRFSVGSLNASNIDKNVLIVSMTATVLTVVVVNGTALFAQGPITGCTVTAPGKVTYVPSTGHTNIYYTVEEWHPDVPTSERNQDVKIANFDLSLPGSGNATVDITAVGLDQSSSATVYFTSPTAETTSPALVAASGVLVVGGVPQAVVTDLKVTLNGNEKVADGVVGSNIRPDVFRGKVMVSGSFTAYFDSLTLSDAFRNETSVAILSVLSASTTANADFISICIPVADANTSTPEDGETGLKRTYNFVAEMQATAGAGTEVTTIQAQDSMA